MTTSDLREKAYSIRGNHGSTRVLSVTALEDGDPFSLVTHPLTVTIDGVSQVVSDVVDNTARVTLVFPDAGSSVPLVWLIDGNPVTIGKVFLSDAGAQDIDLDLTLTVAPVSLTLSVVGGSGGSGGGAPSGPAGGALGGTYPDPTFAEDMATQAELTTEAGTRGAADTALDGRLDAIEAVGPLASIAYVDLHDTLAYDAAVGTAATDATSKANAAQAAAIAAAATDATTKANAAQAAAVQRANHTGVQAISTVTGLQTALDDKAPLANAALTGNPTAPTPTAGDADTSIATTAFVAQAVVDATVGLLDYRGAYNASGNTFPASGGSGAAGAVLKSDFWIVSVAGTLGGQAVTAGDMVAALVDTPGQTAGNWSLIEHDLGYAPENLANKSTDGTLAANSSTLYPSQSAVKTYADGKVAQTITDGVTTSAPSQDAVRDALVAAAAAVAAGYAPLASQLKATAVKTAAYGPAAGEFVPVDSTSGTVLVTLPSAPADGSVIAVKRIAGTNLVTYACGGSDVLNTAAGSTSGTLQYIGHQVTLIYKATGGIWYVETAMSLSGLDTRYLKRAPQVTTITSSATPTFNTDTCEVVKITALAAAITSMVTNKTGTPSDEQKLQVVITDDGTPRSITWGADYVAMGVALPTTTVTSKKLRVGLIWHGTLNKWGCVAVAQEA